ncbi:MAG: HD domain-containing protein [Candidatus Micrarchaeaceae archaeon]
MPAKKYVILLLAFMAADIMFVLPLWESIVGELFGFILNLIFLSVAIYLFFSFKKQYSSADINFNIDIDSKELTELAKSLKELFEGKENIEIQNLSQLWKDEDPKKSILKNANEHFDIDMSVVKTNWFLQDMDPTLQSYTFETKSVKNFYKDLSVRAKDLDIVYDKDLDSLVFYLLSLIDKYGNIPSVVDLKSIPDDPDALKRSIKVGNTNLYILFRTNVTLRKHLLACANKILYGDIKDSNGKLLLPALDGLDFLFAIIAALAHDIGKMPNVNVSDLPHNLASAEVIKTYIEDTNLPNKYDNYIKDLINAIENHHNTITIDKNESLVKGASESQDDDAPNKLLHYLYIIDLQERLEEKDQLAKSVKKTSDLFSPEEGDDDVL